MEKFKGLYLCTYIILLVCVLGTLQSYNSFIEANMYHLVESSLKIDEFKSSTEGDVSLETLYVSAELAIVTAAQQSEGLRKSSLIGLIVFPFIFFLSLYVRIKIVHIAKALSRP